LSIAASIIEWWYVATDCRLVQFGRQRDARLSDDAGAPFTIGRSGFRKAVVH